MTDAEAQHLKYVFEGYRSRITKEFEGEEDSPYSPDCARNLSWREGYKLAQKDEIEVENRRLYHGR